MWLDWLIDWLLDWLIYWLIDWVIEWLIHWFIMCYISGHPPPPNPARKSGGISAPPPVPSVNSAPSTPSLKLTSAGNTSFMPVTTVDKGVLSCIGEFRYPGGCTEDTCEYIAQWEYMGATDDIKFNIITSRPDEWTGIGFADKRQMVIIFLFIFPSI